MSEIAISVNRLSKKYEIGRKVEPTLRGTLQSLLSRNNKVEDFWALRDVCFEVQKGEAIGIIGKNGAGKSTLLKLLSRITYPTHGHAVLDGRVASLLEVGTGFHPELTGRENVYLNGSLLGMAKHEIKANFDAIVDFSGVARFIDTPVKRYSSGMYMRLAFAVAAHLRNEILLVDEVLAVGDQEFQEKCIGKMDSIANSGKTVIFVSHDEAAIQKLCKRSLLFENGQLIMDGKSPSVFAQYLSTNTSTFLVKEYGKNSDLIQVKVQYDNALVVQATYKMKGQYTIPHLGIAIQDDKGHLIFATNPTTEKLDLNSTYPSEGTVTITATEPKLNHGRYSISIWFGDGNRDVIVDQDALSFEVPHTSIPERLGLVIPKVSYTYQDV